MSRALKTLDGLKSCAKCGVKAPVSSFRCQRKNQITGKSYPASYCRPCEASLSRDYKLKNPGRDSQYNSLPEVRARRREQYRLWRLENPVEYRNRHLRRHYKITETEYRAMVEKQSGQCAICKTVPEKKLMVDHCHKTGTVRQLLCFHCNSGLGFFRDDVSRLLSAADYLNGGVK